MTPGEFIAAFDVIAEAPGGIERLRELVLQLAVRGKLVPQDLGDEPASELLSRAKAAKIREMIERKIRRDSEPELSESAGEASSPTHWVWTHLYDFALVLGGKRLPAGASFSTEKTDNIYIRVTDMKDGSVSTEDLRYISDDVQARIAKYTIDREDLYITIAGTIGDVGEVPEHFHGQNLTENAAKIAFREVDKRFLLLVLRSGDVKEQFQEKMKQMAQPKLALKRISGARVPIPPLAEQHRIVVKADELMGLIDRLAATRRNREDCRTAGRDSALAALRNAATPEEVGAAWTRIAERMDDLFTAPADLAPLREAVLQLAVRGRLVPQDADEEPADKLVAELEAGKERLLAKEIITKSRYPCGIPVEQEPFEIPETWQWLRLGDVSAIVGGGTPRSGESSFWSDGQDIPWLTPADMRRQPSRYISRGERDITSEGLSRSSAQMLPAGSVLFSSRAPIGHVGIAANPLSTNQGFKSCVPYISAMSDYLYVFLKYAGPGIDEQATGTTFKEVAGKEFALIPVPIAPLAEQHRIVAKVDELMGLIDRLEKHLIAKEETQGDFAAAATNVV